MSITTSTRRYTPHEQMIMDAGIELGRKEVLETLWDMEQDVGNVCTESSGTQGCEEASTFQWVRTELEKRLNSKNNSTSTRNPDVRQ